MSLTDPASPEPSQNGRAFGFALAAVALAVVVAVVAALLLPGDDDPEASDAPVADAGQSDADESDESSDESDSADDDGDEPSLEALVSELIDFVERERGLDFITDPIVTVQPEDEFLAAFGELVDDDLAENELLYEQATEIFQAIGFLAPDVTYEAAYRALAADGILGYYETELNELYVRGGEITPLVRSVIVHELVHALDDQHFELYRPEYDDRDDEVGFGLQALAEGNARRIENAYRATFTAEEEADAFAEESSFSYDFSILPFEFLNLIIAPYIEGEELVAEVLDDGGQAELDELYVEPPVTSEQVIHPERRTEAAAPVPVPPADGEVFDSGTFGQIAVQVLLEASLGLSDAADAAEGWGGDSYVLWLDDDEVSCLRVHFVADTADDLDELFDGLTEWAGDADLRVVEVSTIGSDVVELTTCN